MLPNYEHFISCNQAWNDNLHCYAAQHKLIEAGWLIIAAILGAVNFGLNRQQTMLRNFLNFS